MQSIRTYLVVVILSVICLSNFIAALQGYRDSLASADRFVDEQIIEKYNALSVLAAHEIDVPQKLYNDDTLFQVWEEGVLVKKSNNSPDTQLIIIDSDFHIVNYNARRWSAYGEKIENNRSIIVALKYDIYSN